MDQPQAEVEHEAAVRLAGERRTGNDPIDLELESRRLDGLPQQLEQFAVGSRRLVGGEDVLPGRQGEVPALRLDLALEDGLEGEFRVGTLAEQGLVQGGLDDGIEGGTHGHRRLLGQPWGRVLGEVAQVKLFGVLFPESHGRVAEGTWCLHGNLLVRRRCWCRRCRSRRLRVVAARAVGRGGAGEDQVAAVPVVGGWGRGPGWGGFGRGGSGCGRRWSGTTGTTMIGSGTGTMIGRGRGTGTGTMIGRGRGRGTMIGRGGGSGWQPASTRIKSKVA